MTQTGRLRSAAPLLTRLAAALPLGYALVASGVSALAGILAHMGMARADAVVLMAMLGFLLYLAWLVWVFAARSLRVIYAVLVLGYGAARLAEGWLSSPGG